MKCRFCGHLMYSWQQLSVEDEGHSHTDCFYTDKGRREERTAMVTFLRKCLDTIEAGEHVGTIDQVSERSGGEQGDV
jgi:hypothetical protein